LYSDAGWASYLKDINVLVRGIENSLDIVTAWDNDKLVGLIRIVGDGSTIIYIQDILILKEYKRKGIGRKLMLNILEKYSEVRQIVLLTDDSEETRGFYESLGFTSNDKGGAVSFGIFR